MNPRARFEKVRQGFDPKEVDACVAEVASKISALEDELRKLGARRAAEGRPSLGEDRLSRFFVLAEDRAAALVAEAKTESHRLSTDSKREAERLVTEAKAEADRSMEEAAVFLHHARQDSDRTKVQLEGNRRTALEAMRTRLLSLLSDIERALDPSASEDGSTRER